MESKGWELQKLKKCVNIVNKEKWIWSRFELEHSLETISIQLPGSYLCEWKILYKFQINLSISSINSKKLPNDFIDLKMPVKFDTLKNGGTNQ